MLPESGEEREAGTGNPVDSAVGAGTPKLSHDVLVIIGSLVCSLVVAPALSLLGVAWSVGLGGYFGDEACRVYFWWRSCVAIVGRLPWDLLSGWLLGRCLGRLRPWIVFLPIAAFYLGAHLVSFSLRMLYDLRGFSFMGTSAHALIALVLLAEIIGATALGIFLGIRSAPKST